MRSATTLSPGSSSSACAPSPDRYSGARLCAPRPPNHWIWLLTLAVLIAAAPIRAAAPPVAGTASAPDTNAETHDFVFPRRRQVDGFELVLHAPQIRSWPAFERFVGLMAIEVNPPDGSTVRYATVTVQGSTEVDLERHTVRVIDPEVVDVRFSGVEPPDTYRQAVRHASRDGVLEVPLELFVAAVADDVLSDPPPPGFNATPPAIAVRSRPTLLLFVNGEPVGTPIAGTSLEVVVNANWPVVRTQGPRPRYYLLNRDRWYVSSALDKGWKPTGDLPEDFTRIPDDPAFAALRAAIPAPKVSGSAPDVLHAATSTELIVTDGRAKLEEIPGTDGLAYVTNTESQLFKLDDRWFFLASGRWFTTRKLDKGPWTYVSHPPAAFGRIPDDHETAEVRASVPGTIEAKMAAVEALLPTRVTVRRGDAPPITVDFAGDPQFQTIPGTTVARALNTGYDVLQADGHYYLLYSGIWYVGEAPNGPWSVASSIPDAIYAIPPSSPSYHVTQVAVAASTADTVTYTYPASYSTSTYVVYGVPYYGTGWYYYPWIYGGYYYPYWSSYGHGSWYNPATGRYGSRSVWYGPYGGYSYTQGYNPRTGRYGYIETAWDGDDWQSFGETYNPRTGVSTKTERHYSEDGNNSTMERVTERGDEWVRTERQTDFDSGTSNVQRETSRGGSSEMQRQRTADGISSEGSITTGGGQEFDVSREIGDGQRTSTITGDSGSISTDTRRQNGRSVTSIEGSGGGQGVSVSGAGGRTTIGQSDSGDIYAGHNGNVYKKSDDGWMEYENGGWQESDRTQRTDRAEARAGAGTEQAGDTWRQRDTAGAGERLPQAGQRPMDRPDLGQLNRDYEARQRSQRQYEQRMARDRGGFQRGGGGFRGMGGGGGFRRR